MRESDEISAYSKKMQSALNREYRKMYRNLNGMRTMNRIPNCIVVIDPKKEKNAVREASKLGVTTVALIDTDCDPDVVDLPIPGNDDGIRSIDLIMTQLADAVIEGIRWQPRTSRRNKMPPRQRAGGSRIGGQSLPSSLPKRPPHRRMPPWPSPKRRSRRREAPTPANPTSLADAPAGAGPSPLAPRAWAANSHTINELTSYSKRS